MSTNANESRVIESEQRQLGRLRRASRIGTLLLVLATLALGTAILCYAKLELRWPKSLAACTVLYVCLEATVLTLLHRRAEHAERRAANER